MTDPRAAMVRARLAAAGCVAPDAEASELLARRPDDVTLDRWLARREQGEPLPWITGSLRFAGRRILIDAGVYVPRPQSEVLAARAAAVLPPGGRALDLCTGSGAIAAHLMAERPAAGVVGVDRDPLAAACAARNGVAAVVADVRAPLAIRARSIDVVTAVAPYVPSPELAFLPSDVVRHEPSAALDGGPDGLDLVRAVVGRAAEVLRPGRWLLLEVGGGQDGALAPALAASAFTGVEPWHDEDGDLRGLAARFAPGR